MTKALKYILVVVGIGWLCRQLAVLSAPTLGIRGKELETFQILSAVLGSIGFLAWLLAHNDKNKAHDRVVIGPELEQEVFPTSHQHRRPVLDVFISMLAVVSPDLPSPPLLRKEKSMDKHEAPPPPPQSKKPFDVEAELRKPDPVPPDLPTHIITSQGRWEDARARRRMRSEQYTTEVYLDLVERHNQMWQKFAGMLDTRHQAEKKAHEIRLDRERAKQQAATLAAEVKQKEADESRFQRQIDEDKATVKRAEDLHQLDLETKRLANEETKAKIALIKPKDGEQKKQSPIDQIIELTMSKANDRDKLEKAGEFIKTMFSADVAEDALAILERKRQEFMTRDRS